MRGHRPCLGRACRDELGIPGYFYESLPRRGAKTLRTAARAIRRSAKLERRKARLILDRRFGMNRHRRAALPPSGPVIFDCLQHQPEHDEFPPRQCHRPRHPGIGTRSARADREVQSQKYANGEPERIPGSLKAVKGGWYIEEYGIAQLSLNLTDIQTTPVHTAFDEACAKRERGIRVTGSELVGLLPLRVTDAADLPCGSSTSWASVRPKK